MKILTNHMENIDTAMRAGDEAAAIGIAEQILSVEPYHSDTRRLLARIFKKRGDLQTAITHYSYALLAMPHDRELLSEFDACITGPDHQGFRQKVHATLDAARADAPDPNRAALQVFETANGPFALPLFPINDRIGRNIRKGVIFDSEVLEAARPYIAENTTVIDAGANFGQLAVEFSRALKGTGQVIACEADSYVAEILRRNAALSKAANIDVAEGALWDVDGHELVFPEPDFDKYYCFGSFGLDPTAKEGKIVKTHRIDSLPIRHRVSFIKIDVQGADLHAMRGARETILRDKPVIIFEYEEQFQAQFGTTHQQYFDFVASIGYRVASQLKGLDYLILPQN